MENIRIIDNRVSQKKLFSFLENQKAMFKSKRIKQFTLFLNYNKLKKTTPLALEHACLMKKEPINLRENKPLLLKFVYLLNKT